MFRGRPLTLPDDGQPRAVKHQMDGFAGRDRSQTAPQMLTAPGERRIVGGGEVEGHHPEQGVQEPFGLAQREAGWALQKQHLRKYAPRSPDNLRRVARCARYRITPHHCHQWFAHAGYQA